MAVGILRDRVLLSTGRTGRPLPHLGKVSIPEGGGDVPDLGEGAGGGVNLRTMDQFPPLTPEVPPPSFSIF